MKAEEIRLGNIIGSTNKPEGWRVYRTDFQFILDNEDDYFGIQLTPEWLEKFGFEAQPNGIWYLLNFETKMAKGSIGVMCFCNNGETIGGTIQIGGDVHTQAMKGCRSVHELQNLYFALSGQELELKQ